MKKCVLLLLGLFAAVSLSAQERPRKSHTVNLYLTGLEYSYDMPLAGNWTIRAHTGLDALIGWSSSQLIIENEELGLRKGWFYAVRAAVGADFRNYYNLSRRAMRGQTTAHNAANFWAIDLQYFTPTFIQHWLSSDGYVQLSPYWGLRRVYWGNWIFELNLGVNVATTGKAWGWGPKIGLKMGVAF